MSFHAQTTHPDATLALNGKTIHGHGPTHVTRAEAEHLRVNATGVQVTETKGGPDEPETEPFAPDLDERRQHELRERRGEYAPTYDHGHPTDPTDPYRERREIQHAHNPGQVKHQTRPAPAKSKGKSKPRGKQSDEQPDEKPDERDDA